MLRSSLYLLSCLFAVTLSFSPSRYFHQYVGITSTRTHEWAFHSRLKILRMSNSDNKEDEIARLQEQIRRLQDESTQDASKVAVTEREKPAFADKRFAELERVRGKEMPFSEGDLIDANIITNNEDGNNSGGIGSVLPAALLAVGALVAFVAFSQVPVGQEDFARYSVAPPTQTIDLGDLNPDRKST